MMCKGAAGCKQFSETGFIFVNGVKFARVLSPKRKINPRAENRLANVCLDC